MTKADLQRRSREQLEEICLNLDKGITGLQERYAKQCDMIYNLSGCFNQLFKGFFKHTRLLPHEFDIAALATADHRKNPDYYHFIPMNTTQVLGLVQLAKKTIASTKGSFKFNQFPKFLDVGCGLGNVLIAASTAFDVYGIEFSERYVLAARRMLKLVLGIKNPELRIIHKDALTYNGYSKYDVIYYYVPIHNAKKMNELLKRILKQMKVGACLIPLGFAYVVNDDLTGKNTFIGHLPNFKLAEQSDGYFQIFQKMSK